MDLLKRFGNCFQFFNKFFTFSKKCNKEKNNTFDKYAYYTYKFQNIVTWEYPVQTVTCLLIIQLIFWMVINLCWKFYGILFTFMLIFCTHDMWTEKIWPEIRVAKSDITPYNENLTTINSRMLSIDEINKYFNNFLFHLKMTCIRLKNLRSSQPVLFCAGLSFCFSTLIIIGCAISGMWLLYIAVMTAFVSPGIYIHVLPESYKSTLKQCLITLSHILSSESYGYNDEDDEYIPSMSKESMNEAYTSVFQLKAENAFPSLVDDEVLVSGLTVMPSFDDITVDGNDDDSKCSRNSRYEDLNISDSSSISSDISDSMKFQGAHFNNADDELDTSEDESGNTFIPNDPIETTSSQNSSYRHENSNTFLSNIVSKLALPYINQLGKNILTNFTATSSTVQRSQQKPKSTDEEFEIINENDIN